MAQMERYLVKKDGLTIGDRVYSEGDVIAADDFSGFNRERMVENARNGRFQHLEAIEVDEDEQPLDEPLNLSRAATEQPQGEPGEPLAGDDARAMAARVAKNRETSGKVSEVGAHGTDTQVDAEKYAATFEARGVEAPPTVDGSKEQASEPKGSKAAPKASEQKPATSEQKPAAHEGANKPADSVKP